MHTRGVARRIAALTLAGAVACSGEGAGEAPATGQGPQAGVASPDPCSLLTRAEAEAVLGTLVSDPYRSRIDTSEVRSDGPTCTYATAGGKVLLLTPEWTLGKMMIDTERMIGGLVRLVADLPGIQADTLEGLWDDAVVGLRGDLVLRKGARSLTIAYLGSSTDAAGALRLAGPALTRLAAVPEPPRATVSAAGCPLPPEVVSRTIGMPVRLPPGSVRLMDACSYELVEDPTVSVELAIKPSAVADMLFEGLRARAKGLMGSTPPDSVAMGDLGLAYGSQSGSEAAVQKGEHVYHALMQYPLSTTTPDLKEAMLRLVAAMMSATE